ncbi:hypothetical protein AMJ39_06375 [candidate division TA06 bacterium DG_24]|nr:MAG: hypothetical protein AMJ39_06375 [candidate division TA06 bacterium DG_24]
MALFVIVPQGACRGRPASEQEWAATQVKEHMGMYRILDWDTDFFGFRVAFITAPRLDSEELARVLSTLREENVKLVYWPSDSTSRSSQPAAQSLGGFLADKKTTFFIDFSTIVSTQFVPAAAVEPYQPSMRISDLEALGVQSGEYSRFAVDPRIPRKKFVELYTTWIHNCLKGMLADAVLVIRDGESVVGMVTLGSKGERGEIGLIAVDGNYRGREYGETLVRSAQQWFMARGFRYGQVVTQQANVPACNLYEKCGYSIEKVDFYYHFWL